MKMSCRVLLLAFVVLACLCLPASVANARATVEKNRIDVNEPFEIENPCTGMLMTGVIEGQGFATIITDDTGAQHLNLVIHVHGTAVDASGTQYVVGQNVIATGSENAQGSEIITAVVPIQFVSLDSSDNYIVHAMAHITTTPSGKVITFEFISEECRG